MRSVRPTARGVLVLAGAVIAYLAGWAFGTHELAALALALALALPVAVVTVSRARRVEVRLVRRLPARTTEGHPVEASILVEPALRLVSAALVERCAGLGDPTARLRHVPGGLVGRWTIDRPDRGRYRLAPELVLEDALGLVRSRIPLDAAGLLRVEPRLVELGAQRSRPLALRDGARHAFRASAGDELAGVRDHEVGESLRRVHWRTTARRGRLTVREVEDHPREELLVLLDAASPGPAAAPRSPAFECAVRAAGSLAVHAARSWDLGVVREPGAPSGAGRCDARRVHLGPPRRAVLGRVGWRLAARVPAPASDRVEAVRRHLRSRTRGRRAAARAAGATPSRLGRRGRCGIVGRGRRCARRLDRRARARGNRGGRASTR